MQPHVSLLSIFTHFDIRSHGCRLIHTEALGHHTVMGDSSFPFGKLCEDNPCTGRSRLVAGIPMPSLSNEGAKKKIHDRACIRAGIEASPIDAVYMEGVNEPLMEPAPN